MKTAQSIQSPASMIQQAPLLRIALCLMAGMFAADLFGAITLGISLVAIPLFVGSLVIREKKALLMSAALYLLTVGVGAGVKVALLSSQPVGLAVVDCTEAKLVGIVDDEPRATAKGQKAFVQVVGYVREDGKLQPVRERILVYLKPEMTVARHDSVHLRADLRDAWSRHASYLNYLKRSGVQYVAYAKQVIRTGQDASFNARMERMQTTMSDQLAATMPGDSTAAGIARAMFLGDTDHLDRDLRRSFADAGLSHVLAISGMHITAMFLMLNWLLTFLPLHLRTRLLLMLGILLTYMLLTGASPSVVRAVLVSATVIVAQLAHLRTRALNLLGAAAIAQILYDPSVMYQLGFQLSYAAVAGILLLFPLYERLTATTVTALKHLHEWVGVTLSAQTLTTPIILAVFGKFPAYFLLSNVAVALLGTVCTFAGFITLLVSAIPGVNTVAGWICAQLLNALAVVATWFATLPHAVLSADNLSPQGLAIIGLQLLGVVLLGMFTRWVGRKQLAVVVEEEAVAVG